MRLLHRFLAAASTGLVVSALSASALAQQGTVVADNGFRANVNGFNFPNYGNDKGFVNLTSADVRRLFGDAVCASLQGDECVLVPAGQQWMRAINEAMDGGHCDGFAALSGMVHRKQIDPESIGGTNTFAMDIATNVALQREIAFWWATQVVTPTQDGYVLGTPSEILDKLIAGLKSEKPESYTVAVRMAGKGGHAVTPYAVEDMGNQVFNVLVYDNNFPGAERRITVDKGHDTWEYNLSTRPDIAASKWTGTAETKTFLLKTNSYRARTQDCPFCEPGGASGDGDSKKVADQHKAGPAYNQLWIGGDGVRIVITDAHGKRFGMVGGKMLKEIPGVQVRTLDGNDLWDDDEDPVYLVPADIQFSLTLDGSALKKETRASVTMIGPGYDLAVEDIKLSPGEKDEIQFSHDGKSVSYKTSSKESPELELGYDGKDADYSFDVKGVELAAGGAVNVALDKEKGTLKLFATGGAQKSSYSLVVGRIDTKGEIYFGHEKIELGPKDSASVDYTKWTGNGATMPLHIDRNNDGTIDETIQLTDEDAVTAKIEEAAHAKPAPKAPAPTVKPAPSAAPSASAMAPPAATPAPAPKAEAFPVVPVVAGGLVVIALGVGALFAMRKKKD
jgi:hypothetical protein